MAYIEGQSLKDRLKSGLIELDEALGIDESIGEAHSSMAWVHTYFDWDWESAEKEHKRSLEHFQKTIEIDLNFAWVYAWQSLAFWEKQMKDKALDSIQKAVTIAPGITTK